MQDREPPGVASTTLAVLRTRRVASVRRSPVHRRAATPKARAHTYCSRAACPTRHPAAGDGQNRSRGANEGTGASLLPPGEVLLASFARWCPERAKADGTYSPAGTARRPAASPPLLRSLCWVSRRRWPGGLAGSVTIGLGPEHGRVQAAESHELSMAALFDHAPAIEDND